MLDLKGSSAQGVLTVDTELDAGLVEFNTEVLIVDEDGVGVGIVLDSGFLEAGVGLKAWLE